MAHHALDTFVTGEGPIVTEQPTTATTPTPAMEEEAQPATKSRKSAWWRRRWVQLVAAGLFGVAVGTTAAGDDSALVAARQATEAAEARADRAEAALKAAEGPLRQQAAGLEAQAAALAKKQADLETREAKVAATETRIAADTIPGEGQYVVGTDVKPGVYRAGPAASGNCYWARLSGLSTDDIIDNGNTSGQLTIEVKASDKALVLSGCSDFRRVR